MDHNTSSECLHEEQIQAQSRKIERLEARADFKEQRIDELNYKMDKLNDKFDKVLEGFNELNIKSTEDDSKLELRLATIEKELDMNKKSIADNRSRMNMIISVITIIFVALTFYFNFIK